MQHSQLRVILHANSTVLAQICVLSKGAAFFLERVNHQLDGQPQLNFVDVHSRTILIQALKFSKYCILYRIFVGMRHSWEQAFFAFLASLRDLKPNHPSIRWHRPSAIFIHQLKECDTLEFVKCLAYQNILQVVHGESLQLLSQANFLDQKLCN